MMPPTMTPDQVSRPLKSFVLPPGLDRGLLKLEDLHFDVEQEAIRLRNASRPQ